MLMERKRFAAERAGAADKQSGGGSTGGGYAVFSLSHISRGTICSLPDRRLRIRAADLFRAVCTSLSAANPALPFRLRRSCVSHGTSSGSAGPVAVSPANTVAALHPAVRSFEKTPCLAPFLWYNCCELTIRRRRSRPGRNRFYPAAALKTFLTCAGFAVPTLFARQGSPCGQSSHRQKGFERSPPLRYHGGSQMSGIAETTERLFWECRGGIRDRAWRNAAKPCNTCVCGTFHDCRKRYKIGFDHINDHRQKNL